LFCKEIDPLQTAVLLFIWGLRRQSLTLACRLKGPEVLLLETTVITGFNTDIEHNGTVYHVQTEDKGLDAPVILSLVYVGGAILASKRSPYDDLVAAGYNAQVLAERLQRQHKLICAAINAGRIEDLKRLQQRETAPQIEASAPQLKQPEVEQTPAEDADVPVL